MDFFLLTSVFLVVLLSGHQCEDSPAGMDDAIPMLASGKRQHNIMRFGKRPAGGHSLIHFGKRENGEDSPAPSKAQHSFLYFGKRDGSGNALLDYLQRNRESSYKRGHNIMRFGKRAPGLQESHNFIRFGRIRPSEGHSMLYFGKRPSPSTGHSMLYFGKRDSTPDGTYEDLDDLEKRAHSMIHFGKRDPEDDEDPESIEKRQHNLLRFGKKMDRKGSHAMIHFGKRSVADPQLTRMKRELPQVQQPAEDESKVDETPSLFPDVWDPMYYEDDTYPEYDLPDKKQSSKNVFLRFG